MKRHVEYTWTSVIDYLKAIAICLVITNHSLTAEARSDWSFFFIVRMAVPIFILVSGYNFSVSMRRLNSVSAWYAPNRLLRKMRTYLLPMLIVYALWLVKELLHSDCNIWIFTKAMILQSYGQGAYYFWIIVQLYLMFPLIYWLMQRYKGGGIFIILIFNILYEVILYLFPIPISFYRIIALRYVMLLALGCWVCAKTQKQDRKITNSLFHALCFIIGCMYIAFFSVNKDNTEIFRYTIWGNTNVFSCLYITPLFYLAMVCFKDASIKVGWLHRLISCIGRSSYHILCTQMIMFWFIARIWNRIHAPLSVSVVCNIILAVVSGACINWLVNRHNRL